MKGAKPAEAGARLFAANVLLAPSLVAAAGAPGAAGDFLALLDGVEEFEVPVDRRGGMLRWRRGRGLGVFVDIALVVSQHEPVRRLRHHVVRVERNLAAPARAIDDELRDGVAAGVAAQVLDNFEPLAHRSAEVRRTLDEVALVEIVGPNAAAEQLLHEHLHGGGIVVDAAEEHGLVAERDARVGETPERVADLDGQLLRMVDVDTHPERVEFLQHRAQFGRDPLRQEDGHAAADTQELDVLNRAQAAEEILQPRIGEQQRVAARKQDVAHFGVLLEVVDGPVEIELELLFADAADHAAAGAVAAVGSAAVGDEKKDAVGVTVHQPRHRHVVVLAARVGHVLGRVSHFLNTGNNLAADGAVRIEGVDQIEEVGRDAHRQFGVGEKDAGVFLLNELDLALELIQRLDAVAHLPLPVIPLLGRGVGPVSLAGRSKVTIVQVDGLGIHEETPRKRMRWLKCVRRLIGDPARKITRVGFVSNEHFVITIGIASSHVLRHSSQLPAARIVLPCNSLPNA